MKKFAVVSLCLVAIGFVAWGVYSLWLQPAPTVPDHAKPLDPKQQTAIEKKLQSMSLKDKVASLFVLHTPGVDRATLSQFVDTYQPGGFILMGDNIPASHSRLQQLTASLRGDDSDFPRLVAIDQEGGIVARLKADNYQAADVLKNKPVAATSAAFEQRSQLVHDAGINLNFGIIADTTADPESFIYDRVLGTTPQASADRVAAAVKASQGLTLTTLKHFPGHGQSQADSHHTIPATDISYDYWLSHDAVPFEAGIKAGADVVMMGHLRYSAIDSLPASLSVKWHQILTDKLGYQGAVITDDMVMLQNSGEPSLSDPVKNAIAALQAGNDLLLYVLNNSDSESSKIDPARLIDGVVAAVENQQISPKTIDDAALQVLKLQLRAANLEQS